MSGRHVAVFGVFSTADAVEVAIGDLKDMGFRSTDVSFLRPLVPEVNASVVSIGDRARWLAGIADLVIPGAGPCLAAGPIVGALGGVGVRGAVGGAADALIGLGLVDDQARRYESRVRRGCILLAAHADEDPSARKAREILERTGAEDIVATADIYAGITVRDDLTRPIAYGRSR